MRRASPSENRSPSDHAKPNKVTPRPRPLPRRITAAHQLLELQQSAGNQAVVSLVQSMHVQRDEAAKPPADVSVGFNPMDINHKLLLAIDQSDGTMASSKPFQMPTGPLIYRKVDYNTVVALLTDLTAGQVEAVRKAYQAHEGRSLETDLFGTGGSGLPTALTNLQQQRLRALLRGTKAAESATAEEQLTSATAAMSSRAIELHTLLHGSLNEANRERILRLIRQSADANSILQSIYMAHTQSSLATDLRKLPAVDLWRSNHLMAGNPLLADQYKIKMLQAGVEIIDAKINGLGDSIFDLMEKQKLTAERKKKVEDLQNRADVAVKTGVAQQVLGGRDLAAVVGGKDAAILTATLQDNPAAKTAATLYKARKDGNLSGSKLTAALRALREEAKVRSQTGGPINGQTDPVAKEKILADKYFQDLGVEYDKLITGAENKFATVLKSAGSDADAELNQELNANRGQLTDINELVHALSGSRKDLAAVQAVLKNKSANEILVLKTHYLALTGRTLDYQLFGDAPTRAGGSNPRWIKGYLLEQGKASGTDRLNLEDFMQRPDKEGGPAEVLYITERAEREYRFTIDNRGVTGWWRDSWGNEQRSLLDETIAVVRKLKAEYLAGAGIGSGIPNPNWHATARAHGIIEEMRLARATIRGDRAAYEKATAELRATFRAIASFALQIALTAVIGPLAQALLIGELAAGATLALRMAKLAQTAMVGTAATIGANLAVYGPDYSLDMFKGDLLGGLGSAIGPAGIDKLIGPYAKGLAAKLGPKLSAELTAVAKTAAGMETGAWAQGESGSLSLEGVVKAHIMGRTSDVATAKLQTGLGLAPPAGAKTTEPDGTVPADPAGATPAKPVDAESTTRIGPDEGKPLTTTEALKPVVTSDVPAGTSHDAHAPGSRKPAEARMVLQPQVHNEVEAFKLYKKFNAADPSLEVGLLFNHTRQEWAVVHGGPDSVSMTKAITALGWDSTGTELVRHSHPPGKGGDTSKANLRPSGRGADMEVVRQNAARSPGRDTSWHVIDVTVRGKPDRVHVLYSKKSGSWRIYSPAPNGARQPPLTFKSVEAYHQWFKLTFGFEPGPSLRKQPKQGAAAKASEDAEARSTEGPEHTDPVQDALTMAAKARTDTGEVGGAAQDALMSTLLEVGSDLSAMREFVAASAGVAGDQLTFTAMGGGIGKGNSGAPVQLVKNSKGEVVAVLKVFPKIDEFVRELSAMNRLETLQLGKSQGMSALGVARSKVKGQDAGVLVIAKAQGEALDTMMNKAGASAGEPREKALGQLREAIRSTATALAELHSVQPADKVASSFIKKYSDAAVDIAGKLHVKSAQLKQVDLDTTLMMAKLNVLITGLRNNPGQPSIVHGDAHPGNFFWDPVTGVTMIDTPTVHYSIDANGKGTGAAVRDLANFSAKLNSFGETKGITPTEIAVLQKDFASAYESSGPSRSTRESDQFFAARAALGDLQRMMDEGIPSERELRAQVQRVKAALNMGGTP